MNINTPPRPTYKDDSENEENNNNDFVKISLSFLILLTSSFSAYTTYKGFNYDLEWPLALMLAVIVGAGLILVNFVIMKMRRSGGSLLLPFIGFFVLFVFSFISNTNAIYTFFLEKNITKETHEAAIANFVRGTDILLNAIHDNQEFKHYMSRKVQLDVAIANLTNQIQDSRNPGLGTKAKQHLRNIEEILGSELTRLVPPIRGSRPSAYEQYADRLANMIYRQFQTSYGGDSTILGVKGLWDETNKLIKQNENKAKSLLGGSATSELSKHTDKIKRDLNSLKSQAKNAIHFKQKIPEINTVDDEIGPFQYTWDNFSKWINPSAIILSILLSILLDILAPLLSVLLCRSDDNTWEG